MAVVPENLQKWSQLGWNGVSYCDNGTGSRHSRPAHPVIPGPDRESPTPNIQKLMENWKYPKKMLDLRVI